MFVLCSDLIQLEQISPTASTLSGLHGRREEVHVLTHPLSAPSDCFTGLAHRYPSDTLAGLCFACDGYTLLWARLPEAKSLNESVSLARPVPHIVD